MSRALVSVVSFTILLFCLTPCAAQAAGELGLSWDGQAWSRQLDEPMFDPAARWVPGNRVTKAFHVRNQANSGAILTIAVVTRDTDGLLRHEDVTLSARVGPGDWVDLKGPGTNFRLNGDALPKGESRKVEVRVVFDAESPNRSQRKQLALEFRVTLSDDQISPDDAQTPEVDGESTDLLPNSGAPPIGWLLAAAAVAIGSGLTILKRRKREETGYEATH